jgi:hypothetical protein
LTKRSRDRRTDVPGRTRSIQQCRSRDLARAAILAQDEAVLVLTLGAYSLFLGLQMLLTTHYVKRGILTPPREPQAVQG